MSDEQTKLILDKLDELINEVKELKAKIPTPVIPLPRGCQHEYPLTWNSTGGPYCVKCGAPKDWINTYSTSDPHWWHRSSGNIIPMQVQPSSLGVPVVVSPETKESC